MSLNPRGQSALEKAGVIETVKTVSVSRAGVAIHMPDGSIKVMPRNPPNIGISRPRLIAILSEIILSEGKVSIRTNCRVTGFIPKDDGTLEVALSDGSSEIATHLIGADGKWSAVRTAAAEFEKSQETPAMAWKLHTEVTWGVRLNVSDIPSSWQPNIVHGFQAKTLSNAVSAIISQSNFEQRCAAWLVLYDPILEHYPDLAPQKGEGGSHPSSF